MPPPFLLTAADYYGTLAAARCLGAHDVPVVVADDHLFAPTLWSRHVRRRVTCPPMSRLEDYLEWLTAFGDRQPGHVLYPTSDDLAWLMAAHRRELERRFLLYGPDLPTLLSVLDKGRLYGACKAVGIATPETWFPTDEGVERLAGVVRYPLLIKPRTQVLSRTKSKGHVVERASELGPAYRAFRKENGGWPLLQAFYRSALGIRSISGFCTEGAEEFVVRSSQKVLQWPRHVGVGICFEDAPVDEKLASRVRALCRHVGYFGVFEVELLEHGPELMLIDFNPRFFGQLGFDVARGLPSPYLVYLAARGARDALHRAVERACAWEPRGRHLYVNRIALEWSIFVERLLGRADGGDAWRWEQWRTKSRVHDAALDDDDRLPGIVDTAQQLWLLARHPRSIVRKALRGA